MPPRHAAIASVGLVTRAVFSLVSLVLMILAAALLGYSVVQVITSLSAQDAFGARLLDAVGYAVIALAVFEVAKYILEEEVINPSEMRYTGEARRSITKFLSIIAIAVFLEALVLVSSVGKQDVALMLYPTLLLLAGIALIVGLGLYQRLSASAEIAVGGARGEAEAERQSGTNHQG